MSSKAWGALAALAAIVQSSAVGAQSDQNYTWSIGDGWEIKRGDIGCGAFHDDGPFFAVTQRLTGEVSIALRATGGNFSADNPVSLQFWASDSAGQPMLTKTFQGDVDAQTGGSLLRLNGQGDFASDAAGSTRIVVSPGPKSNPQPVALPSLSYALRVMRRCLTELKRVDRGSGRPAATGPVLLNPRSPLVTSEDYPRAALREEGQGVTLAAVTVSARGLISFCRIQRSSGRTDLDEQTCLSLSRRARYTPAIDDRGNPTEGETTQPIRWQLPRD